jgi:hypothetical protein
MLARFRSFVFGGFLGAALVAPLPAAAEANEEPLARFEPAFCPGVVGLQREAAEMMVGRMRATGERLGLHMAPDGDCVANVVVGFVEDGQAFLTRLRDERRHIFAELSREERVDLLSEAGPTRAMLRVRSRSRDGMPISRRENMGELPHTTMWMAHSKIYVATRNDIISALVLFDRDDIRGLNLTQLADYATFRALVHTLPDPAGAGQASILALFDEGGDRPEGLTEFDLAYLDQLYSGLANLPAPAKLAELKKATGVRSLE